MADTLPNITLPAGTWVDIYAVTGITVGTQISIENLLARQVQLVVAASAPVGNPTGYQILHAYKRATSEEGESGIFARSKVTDGLINVKAGL